MCLYSILSNIYSGRLEIFQLVKGICINVFSLDLIVLKLIKPMFNRFFKARIFSYLYFRQQI